MNTPKIDTETNCVAAKIEGEKLKQKTHLIYLIVIKTQEMAERAPKEKCYKYVPLSLFVDIFQLFLILTILREHRFSHRTFVLNVFTTWKIVEIVNLKFDEKKIVHLKLFININIPSPEKMNGQM